MGWTRREQGLVATAATLVFSRVFGLSVVLPNFRGHYEPLGSPVLIGLAFGAYGLTMALMQLPWGMLSDRFGRRPMLVAASSFFVVGSLLAATASSIEVLIAARLMQGMGAISSIAMAAVGESLPAERRTLGMALIGIPAGAGFLLGIAAGPALYPLIGMRGLFLLTAVLGVVAMLPVPWLSMQAPRVAPPLRGLRTIAVLAFTGFVSNYALTTTLFFLPTTDWKTLAPLLVVALLLVGGVSRRIDKSGWTTGPLAIGVVLVAGAASLFVLAGGWALWLGGGLFFTAHAVLQSALPSQVSRVAGAAGGRGHGIQNVVAYTGTFAAGPIAGALAGQPAWAFGVLAALAVTAALLVRAARPQS